jgi:hypothetical protein
VAFVEEGSLITLTQKASSKTTPASISQSISLEKPAT